MILYVFHNNVLQ